MYLRAASQLQGQYYHITLALFVQQKRALSVLLAARRPGILFAFNITGGECTAGQEIVFGDFSLTQLHSGVWQIRYLTLQQSGAAQPACADQATLTQRLTGFLRRFQYCLPFPGAKTDVSRFESYLVTQMGLPPLIIGLAAGYRQPDCFITTGGQ